MAEGSQTVAGEAKASARNIRKPQNSTKRDISASLEQNSEPSKPTRATRAKKGKVMSDHTVQRQPVIEAASTRRTRGITAKAAPLSPKKVTQVSGVATRDARAANNKSASAKDASLKLVSKSRTATRNRAVSDENAQVSGGSAVATEEEDGIHIPSRSPARRVSPQKRSPANATVEENESITSSGPTTAPGRSFEELRDERGHRSCPIVDGISSTSDLKKDDESASEDELCGPKTPMKRSGPGTEARYIASVQRTIRRANKDSPVHTPAETLEVYRRQGRTPRTQNPDREPAVHESAARSMTVGRGSDRALVFRELRAPSSRQTEESDARQLDTQNSGFVMEARGSDQSDVEGTGSETEGTCDDRPAREHSASTEWPRDDDRTELECIELTQPQLPVEEEEDLNETIVMNGGEGSAPGSPASQANTLSELEDTMLIARDIEQDDTCGTGNEIEAYLPAPPQPETLVWENIRQDVTIAVDFSAHLAGARALPQGEPTECLDITANCFDRSPRESDTEVGKGERGDVQTVADSPVTEASWAQQTVDSTVNLNDFIDIAALAEPTQPIEWPSSVDSTSAEEALANDGNRATSGQVQGGSDEPAEHAESSAVPEQQEQAQVRDRGADTPHYALPTLAFDARRKSLPASTFRTPVKASIRPHTSDGASMPRIANPFGEVWWARSRASSSAATPVRRGSSTAHGLKSEQKIGRLADADANASPAMTPVATPQERFPKLGARQNYLEHAKTVAASARFGTPAKTPPRRPNTAQKPASTAVTPRMSSLRPRRQSGAFDSVEEAIAVSPTSTASGQATPTPVQTPVERFPRLAARPNYEEHAKTVDAPRHFHTPAQRSTIKRPSKVFKPSSLRKVTLANGTALASHTPVKTPLKPPAMTSSQAPMTPHPAAPLRDVVALVEVFTLEGASASAPFIALLHRLGAKTTKAWSERVTHVIFKDGSPTTLQHVRLRNKEVDRAQIHCVNSRWISDCDTQGKRMDESDEAYAVDIAEVPRGGKRRRKSMEPAALLNVNGNVVRDRKSSLGRASTGWSPAKKSEITVEITPKADEGKENGEDSLSSPCTPAYLAAPDRLIQQTAPINRMRKLGAKAQERAVNRRLTFWHGGV